MLLVSGTAEAGGHFSIETPPDYKSSRFYLILTWDLGSLIEFRGAYFPLSKVQVTGPDLALVKSVVLVKATLNRLG